MAINLKETGIELRKNQRSYLEKRLLSLEKFVDLASEQVICDVEVSKTTEHHQSGNIFYTEINLNEDGKLYRATATAETIESAIDEAKKELLKELRRSKRKKSYFARKGDAAIKAFVRGGEAIGRMGRKLRSSRDRDNMTS
jgi:ribosomal subunit interface protein